MEATTMREKWIEGMEGGKWTETCRKPLHHVLAWRRGPSEGERHES
jgi:hypothetical protein